MCCMFVEAEPFQAQQPLPIIVTFCATHRRRRPCLLVLRHVMRLWYVLFALQVKDLQSQLKFKRTEVDDMLSAAQAKDRENSKLWEQV